MDLKRYIERSKEIVQERELGELLFFSLKGSHAYNMPGEHSDVDIRGVYLAPTQKALSIRKPQHTLEVMEDDLDLVAYEAERFFHHLLKHNGNMVETLVGWGPNMWADKRGIRLAEFGHNFLTKKLHKYYRGFAYNQFKRASSQIKTGKGVFYTYRELYAGIGLMRTGNIIFDWNTLRNFIEPQIYESEVLKKMNFDRRLIGSEVLDEMRVEFDELTRILDKEMEESAIPADFDGYEEANKMLLQWRLETL